MAASTVLMIHVSPDRRPAPISVVPRRRPGRKDSEAAAAAVDAPGDDATDLARFISRRRRRQLISTGLEPLPTRSVGSCSVNITGQHQRAASSYMASVLIAAAAAAGVNCRASR